MTLIVAAIEGDDVWMVGDAAITGGNIGLRERQYALKIIPIRGNAIIGFSGDHHHGQQAVEQALNLECGDKTIEFLATIVAKVPSVEFAYGFQSSTGPRLYLISSKSVETCNTLHIGLHSAFEEFQRIRHTAESHHAPEAVHTFLSAIRTERDAPAGVRSAVASMLQLFAVRQERDVGGWALAYVLTPARPFLLTYGYSVTDPIVGQLRTGVPILHGTAEAGGFGLSVTEYGQNEGVVVYWLQRSGGFVFVRSNTGYDQYYFEGRPSLFLDRARTALARDVEIWFGDQPAKDVQPTATMSDQAGRQRIGILQSAKQLIFTWLASTQESFKAEATVMVDSEGTPPRQQADALKGDE
jgi:hypothetical protein